MAASSVVTVIGSDVDDEDDLRKVERKSHSKEQMNLDDLWMNNTHINAYKYVKRAFLFLILAH